MPSKGIHPGNSSELIPKQWYWIRRRDGSLAPYVFHKVEKDRSTGQWVGKFFVGSFLVTFKLNQVVGEAKMAKFD